MSLSRNTGYNLIGYVLPMVIMLVSVPILIDRLGEERFGTLSLILLLGGALFFVDLGTGMAVRYELSRKRDAPNDERESIFWTGMILSLLLGLVGAVLVYIGAWFLFSHYIEMSDVVRSETLDTLPWIALNMPLATLEGVLVGALFSREWFLALTVRKVLGDALVQILPLLAIIYIAPTLRIAVPALMLGRLLSWMTLVIIGFRAVPAGPRPQFAKPIGKKLLSYGLWSSAESMGKQILLTMDRFVIGAVIGANAVAYYAVPSNLIIRGQLISRAFNDAIFPRLSRTSGDERARVLHGGVRTNCAVASVLAMAAILAIEPFLTIWLNPTFAAKAAIPGQVIAMSLLPLAASDIMATYLRADGKPRQTMTVIFIEIVPFCAGLYFGSVWLGIYGVAIVRLARCILDAFLLADRAGKRNQATSLMAQGGALLVTGFIAAQWLLPLDLISVVVKAALMAVAVAWAFWTAPELRGIAFNIMSRVRRAISPG